MADTAPVVVSDSPQNSLPRRADDPSASPSPSADKQVSKKKKSTSLPSKTVEYLKAWMMSPEHVAHPYPTEQEKAQIMADTGIEIKQLTNWFVNNRKRYWKPRVEARLQQQAQAQAAAAAMVGRRDSPSCVGGSLRARPFVSLDMTRPPPVTAHQIMQQPALISDGHGHGGAPHPRPRARHAFHHFNHDDTAAAQHVAPNTLQPHHHHPNAISVGSASSLASDSSDSGSLGGGEDVTNISSAATVPPIVSMHHENSAFSSTNPASPTAEDEKDCAITRHEVVDVHVMCPSEGRAQPSLEDLTVLTNIPHSRIVKTYRDQEVSYSFSQEIVQDKEKLQNLRDAEIARVKKECLRMHIDEERAQSHLRLSDPATKAAEKRSRAVSDSECSSDESSISASCPNEEMLPAPVPKRARTASSGAPTAPRTDFQGKDSQCWRDACRDACHGYDSALPTLEEAAHLFGYAS